jgi:hypothetical protein
MRPFAFLILLVGLLSFGCGSNPETRRTTKTIASVDTVGFPKVDPPGASDPASKDIAAKIIAAHTGNDPAMLGKMKGVIFGRDGKHVAPDSPLSGTPVNFQLTASWPERGRYQWTGMAPFPVTVRLVDKQAFRDIPNPSLMPPLSEKQFEDLYAHLYADWMQLLVPLGEADTIVAPGPEFQQGEVKYPSIRVWRAGKPQAILYYDAKTFHVVRLAYDGRENGIPTYIELAFSEHKPTNGFLLAQRVYVRMNGRDFMEFERATLEFPKEHAGKVFTEP